MARFNRFYYEELAQATDQVVLEGSEAHHMLSVLRLTSEDQITLFDGKGKSADAKIVDAQKKQAVLRIVERHIDSTRPQPQLTIALAPPKKDFDDLVVHLAELGVARIIPIQTRYTEVDLSKRGEDKFHERMKKLALRAAKQSGNNWLVEVSQQCKIEALEGEFVVCDRERNGTNTPDSGEDSINILIGPEGGFSQQELELFDERSYKALRLPGGVLRTSTAAISAASILLASKA